MRASFPRYGFAIIPDEAAAVDEEATCRDAEVESALAVVQEAGLADCRVELAADGTVTIVVGFESGEGETCSETIPVRGATTE
jgi:hypothetical protein